MCTGINYSTEDHYFGRNFDYDFSYNEKVSITPRNYEFKFRQIENIKSHNAIIGIAAGIEDYPLYYDACNEKGLAIAGLNFEGNAHYYDKKDDMINITLFEFIPYILSIAETVDEVKELLSNINLVNISFSKELPLSPLHWLISDETKSIVVEPLSDALKVYDNPLGVLTNNPPFDKQLFNLNNYRHLTTKTPDNTFSDNVNLDIYSRGMGAMGLPGDLSSMSRFVKVAFTKENSYHAKSEKESVSQFFHILASVEQQNGCTFIDEHELFEYTIYASCYNTDKGILYYKTYNNSQITAVKLDSEDLNSNELINYNLINDEQINFIN